MYLLLHFQATGRVRVIRLIITHTGFHPAPECRETRLSSHVSVLLPRHPLPGLVEDALDRRRDELEGLLDVLRLLGRGLRVLHPELLHARKAAVTSAARKAAASSRLGCGELLGGVAEGRVSAAAKSRRGYGAN